jgi:uncharacterized membrane protein YedE/YeeE
MDFLRQPWPWYVAGPLIGLTVPALLLLGNKSLGVSSTLRQISAACIPAGLPLLQYNWKKESWNLLFVAGMVIGGFLGGIVFANPDPIVLSGSTIQYFHTKDLSDISGLMPSKLFSWKALTTLKGILMIIVGGFMVGFGTRYAKGCTSGHGILGLSALQWPSLLATASFFTGGILFSKFILPYILSL